MEMVLLGAGASVDAGVPDTFEMTKVILSEFEKQSPLGHFRVVSFIIGGLLLQKGIEGQNPLESGVNVEEFFNAVQLLSDRHTLEAAPFVGSWHPMVEQFDRTDPVPANVQALHRAIHESVSRSIFESLPSHPPSFGSGDIDRMLSEAISNAIQSSAHSIGLSRSHCMGVGREIGQYVVSIVDTWVRQLRKSAPSSLEFESEMAKALDRERKPGKGAVFERICDRMIRLLTKMVWIEGTQKLDYLKPLLSIVERQGGLTIATLNYDNGVELLAQSNEVLLRTGIREWSESWNFPTRQKNGITLLKLHGSVDWAYYKDTMPRPENTMPHPVIREVTAEQVKKGTHRPAVIFGQRNKLTAEGPFLDLLRAFRDELDLSDTLTVIGYSFRDPHVNFYLTQWLNAAASRRFRIIDPAFADSRVPYARELLRRCKDRIEVVSEKAMDGISKVYGSG